MSVRVEGDAPSAGATGGAGGELRRSLSAGHIFFFVVAAAAPLGAIVANGALGILLGNGAGMPGSYIVAGAVLIGFAVGFARMATHVRGGGAFYVYVRRGLGPVAGSAAAYMAVVVYTVMVVGSAAGVGFFANLAFSSKLGIDIPWQGWAGICLAIVAVFGYREVELGARVLAVALTLEVVVLLVLSVAVLVKGGHAGITGQSFVPSTVTSGNVGIGLMFAFASFLGFESAAIYSEEARDGHRTVRRALIAAVLFIAFFYAFVVWNVVNAFGTAAVQGAAAKNPGTLVFRAFGMFTDPAVTTAALFLVVTSALAATVALHNVASRYLFALGRERMLPRALGRTHPRLDSPHLASLTVTAVTAILEALFVIGGADPLLTVLSSTFGLATLGIILLQGGTSASVAAFYWRRRRAEGGVVWTVVISVLAAACLLGAAILVIANYSTLAGDLGALDYAPWLLLIAALVGVGVVIMGRPSPDPAPTPESL